MQIQGFSGYVDCCPNKPEHGKAFCEAQRNGIPQGLKEYTALCATKMCHCRCSLIVYDHVIQNTLQEIAISHRRHHIRVLQIVNVIVSCFTVTER